VAATAAEAGVKAEEIGFPVALKVHAPDVIHKTEVGGVILGLQSAAEVEQRGKELLEKSASARLLVQEMIQGTEVILGARTDPQYGPFLMVGLGGIFVEVLNDKALRLLPVDEEEAETMLKELKGYRVLEGTRGQQRRDIPALVRAITGLSSLYLDHRTLLEDLEINPLIVREQGKGVAAVDVRVIRQA
jgi:acyl-CoA synthetase (NDP forming)